MSYVLGAVVTAVGLVLVALISWFGARAYQKATVRKTDAETGRTDAETRRTNAESAKTEAESWQLLTGGWKDRVTALEAERDDLRTRLAAAEERAESAEQRAAHAEELARLCRVDLDDLRSRYEATAAPGGGLMRADPYPLDQDRTPDV